MKLIWKITAAGEHEARPFGDAGPRYVIHQGTAGDALRELGCEQAFSVAAFDETRRELGEATSLELAIALAERDADELARRIRMLNDY